jgi:tRNA pseudouridine38-40 synthase
VRTLKLTIAYDGTAYAGWQFQFDKPTVQETLESAIAKVTGQRVRVLASGRTDAGVHALGQVAAFRTNSALPPDVLVRALNANLPHDIAVLEAADAPADFHPIRHAVRKRYRYLIHDGPVRVVFGRHFVWHYPYGRLDAEAMQRAAAPLLGTHDFRSFESSGAPRKTSVRTVYDLRVARGRAGQGSCAQNLPSPFGTGVGGEGGARGEGGTRGEGGAGDEAVGCVQRTTAPETNVEHAAGAFLAPYGKEGRGGDENLITIDIEANGFLYNMVRAIVGTLVPVGRGVQSESWPGEVLNAADRRVAGPTAPPQGLCLMWVGYGGIGG